MIARLRATGGRSYGAILFDLLIIGFTSLLVVNSLGLRPGVGMVPLLVGVLTLIAAIVILTGHLFPGLGRVPADRGARPAPVGATGIPVADEEDEVGLLSDPSSRRRQAGFAAWIFGFVALAALTTFYVAMGVALTLIFFAIGLRWLHVLIIVAGTLIGFYALFDLFLRLRL